MSGLSIFTLSKPLLSIKKYLNLKKIAEESVKEQGCGNNHVGIYNLQKHSPRRPTKFLNVSDDIFLRTKADFCRLAVHLRLHICER